MQVVEVGDIGLRHNDWVPEDCRLPATGVIIQATREELRDSKIGRLLYREVTISGEGGDSSEDAPTAAKASEVNDRLRRTIQDLIVNLDAASTTLESMYSYERCHYRDAIDKAKEVLRS